MKTNYITIDRLIFWGFCGTFFFVPIATSPAVISGAISLALWVFSGRFIKDRQMWLNQSWTIPVTVFMILPMIGLLWTEDIAMGLKFVSKSYYWLYAFAIASLTYRGYTSKVFINSFLIGLSISVLISILQYVGLFPMPKGVPGFIHHIKYSLLIVFGLLLLSFYYKGSDNRKQKILLILAIVAYLFSLSVGIGRIGYLTFIVLSPWIFFNILGKKHLLKIAFASILSIAILLSSATVQNRIKLAVNDIKSYYQGNKNTSIGLRLYMWDGAIKIFLENPVIGVGTGGFKKALVKYKNDPNLPDIDHPHNSFFYMATSFGLVGLASLLWLIWIYLKRGWQNRNSYVGFAVLSFGIVFIIGSLSDTEIRSHATLTMLALLTGIKTEQDKEMDVRIGL